MFGLQMGLFPMVLAAVISMVIGFAWYSPMLFGNPWMKLMGYTDKKMKSMKEEMGKIYLIAFGGALIQAFVLWNFVNFTLAATFIEGAVTGFWLWLGFVMVTQLTSYLYMEQKFKLFIINTGFQLTSLVIMGGFLAVFG